MKFEAAGLVINLEEDLTPEETLSMGVLVGIICGAAAIVIFFIVLVCLMRKL